MRSSLMAPWLKTSLKETRRRAKYIIAKLDGYDVGPDLRELRELAEQVLLWIPDI